MGMGEVAGYGMSAANQFAQYKQASMQREVNEATRNINNQRAAIALASTYKSIDSSRDQVKENSIAIQIDAQKAAAQLRGAVAAQAGADGVTGGAVEMSMRDVDVEAARTSSQATINRERELAALSTERRNADMQYSSRLDLMPQPKPDPWSYIGSALFQGFSTSSQFNSLLSAEKKATKADKGTEK